MAFSKDRSNVYLWFDSEYTTLELDKACLLQVALIITDAERFRPILAGNSVHSDWILVRRFLPELVKRMNYRLLDVTGIKLQWDQYWKGERFEKDTPELIRRFFPEAQLEANAMRHDAFFDAQASIAELAYYRSRLEMRR